MAFDFRFIRTHKNEFIWTDDKLYRIVFTDPFLETIPDCDSPGKYRIKFFYYTLTLYTKGNDGGWECFLTVKIFEDPAILDLLDCILAVTVIPARKNAQLCVFEDGRRLYRYTAEAAGFRTEDYFRIDRRYYPSIGEYYDLTIGNAEQAMLVRGLTRDSLYALKDCVRHFVRYAAQDAARREEEYRKTTDNVYEA